MDVRTHPGLTEEQVGRWRRKRRREEKKRRIRGVGKLETGNTPVRKGKVVVFKVSRILRGLNLQD